MKIKQIIKDLPLTLTSEPGVYCVKDCATIQTKKKTPMTFWTLADATGSLKVLAFDHALAEEVKARMQEGMVQVRAEVKVELYDGARSYKIHTIRLAEPAEQLPAHELMERSPLDLGLLRMQLKFFITSITDVNLRLVVSELLNKRFAGFENWPAASGVHHAYLHGLLEHTVRMARAAKSVAPLYEGVNVDVVMAATLLHDAGKTWEYVGPGSPAKTVAGVTLGHIYIVASQFRKAAEHFVFGPTAEQAEALGAGDAPGLHFDDSAIFRNVEHCLLSHHGQLEWGSPVVPVTMEAVILHHIDGIDAKVCAIQRELRLAASVPNPEEWMGSERLTAIGSNPVWLGTVADLAKLRIPERT